MQKWFFKKEIINEIVLPVKINNFVEAKIPVEIESPKAMEFFDKDIKDGLIIKKISIKDKAKTIAGENQETLSYENKRNYNILGLTIVFIISFIAVIILVDTFNNPISKIVPDINFLLYSLYESIYDIVLFLRDLI
tara:strand:+ start:195 stop:602 length:408 start_codon:yes stop_codon:yes gene_type:complete